jgi:MoxR-like ATPase
MSEMGLEEIGRLANGIVERMATIFVGDPIVIRKMLCAGLANGHVLFDDYPGLGKTLLAKLFATVTGCRWGRIQFTPDIMPADILGTRIWKPKLSEFALERGPIFTNILLADEINRAPPKTQAAMLEAMEERQVTIEGVTHRLQPPFFVIATQNPVEQEGTFPLPEAQMDRFLLRMSTGYVRSMEEETEILRRRIRWRSDNPLGLVGSVVSMEQFLRMQEVVENGIYVDDQILDYVSQIVRGTREHPAVEVGSSPRGGLALLKVGRAHAAFMGRDFVTPDDVKLFVHEALCHRLILKMEYHFDNTTTVGGIIDEVLAGVEVPRDFRK